VAVPERPSRRAVSIVSTGQHALWRAIEVKLHSVRCLYVVARVAAYRGKQHGRKSVQDLAMARREFGELTGFDCTYNHGDYDLLLQYKYTVCQKHETCLILNILYSCKSTAMKFSV